MIERYIRVGQQPLGRAQVEMPGRMQAEQRHDRCLILCFKSDVISATDQHGRDFPEVPTERPLMALFGAGRRGPGISADRGAGQMAPASASGWYDYAGNPGADRYDG